MTNFQLLSNQEVNGAGWMTSKLVSGHSNGRFLSTAFAEYSSMVNLMEASGFLFCLKDFQFSIHMSRSHDYKFFLKLHFFKSCLPILINDFWIYMDIFLSVDCGEYKTSRKQSSILVVFICLKVIFLHFVVVPNAI